MKGEVKNEEIMVIDAGTISGERFVENLYGIWPEFKDAYDKVLDGEKRKKGLKDDK